MANSQVLTATGIPFNAELTSGKNSEGMVVQGATSGGAKPHHRVLTADVNSVIVKGSPGQLYHAGGWNNPSNGELALLKIFDKTTAATTSDIPKVVIPLIPGAPPYFESYGNGLEFLNGMVYVVVQGIADNDATALTVAGAGLIKLGWF